MNLSFVFEDGALLTPPLGGTILPGITRKSLIELAGDLGYHVREAPSYSMEQWRDAAATGRLREVFACGTAAVVTAVGQVRSAQGGFTIADGAPGPVTSTLYQALTDIQSGLAADPRGWVRKVPGAALAAIQGPSKAKPRDQAQ